MQPYQEATQEIRRQGEIPLDLARKGASVSGTAASAYLGGTAATKVLAMVNKFVPEDLAIKGLSKIDPRYGKFIKKALSAGQSFDEVRDFLTEKAEEGLQQMAPAQNEEKKEPDMREKVWDLFTKDKTNAPDPAISGFLKVAKQLKDMRGLKDKDKFTALWDNFQEKLNSGKDLPSLLNELMRDYNNSLRSTGSVPQIRGEPEPSQQLQAQSNGMNNLMAALQAAQQSRQNRQKPPM